MTRRIICLFLAVVLAMSMGAISASAESGLSFSAEGLRVLKEEEGFSSKPYWDYAQWTVGYGTKCPDDKVEYYTQNGITEAEAEALLQTYIARFQSEIEKFIAKTGITLNQNQFDALILFTFNCGSAWTYDSNGGLYNAIASGATGNTLIDAFTRWCNAGGQIKTFLLRRRLCEANMYLNGVYSRTVPENFGYVLFDPCGGTVSPNVQGFDANLTSAVIPKPTYSGYTFQGWYTARVGGRQVTVLDASVRNGRLYAHWVDGAGKDPAQDTTGGVTVTVTANDVNVRQGPGTNYKAVGTANKGEQLVITETATGTGYTWGKFYGGWICLDYTTYSEASKPESETPETPSVPENAGKRTGTVKVNDQLRVRSGPSTGYEVVGYLKNGARVEILEQKIAGSMVWGKISNGWISLDYVVLDPVADQTPPTTEPPATEPPATEPPATEPEKPQPQNWTGTVKVNDLLRVRSGPGTSYSVVGYLSPNERVTITEQSASGSMTWGKTAKGWVSMDYIVLDQQSGSGSSGSTAPQKLTGTVKVNDYLRVRTGPGTSYAIAGYLSPNAKVEITEQKTVGGAVWGKTAKGWISLDYVVLDQQSTGSTGGSASQPVTKTVTADCLRVRSAAGTSNKIVGYLYEGAKVQILETTVVNGTTWGRTSKGWISMDYVK